MDSKKIKRDKKLKKKRFFKSFLLLTGFNIGNIRHVLNYLN